jgi:hypothetical protein
MAGGDGGEIDACLGDFVEVICPCVERDVEHDLNDLRIVIATDLTALISSPVTWPRSRTTLTAKRTAASAFVRGAVAVGGNLSVVELGKVLPEISVGRDVIGATVDLGHGERDTLARLGRQGAFVQGAG